MLYFLYTNHLLMINKSPIITFLINYEYYHQKENYKNNYLLISNYLINEFFHYFFNRKLLELFNKDNIVDNIFN